MNTQTSPSRTAIRLLSALAVAALLAGTSSVLAKGGGGGGGTMNGGTNGNGGGSTTPAAPKLPPNYVDQMLAKYDTTHSGVLDKFALIAMSKGDPDKFAEGLTYDADKNHLLDREEIAKWRADVDTKARAAAQAAAAATKTAGGGG